MTHPLTDEELKKLFWDYAVDTGIGYDWTSDGMRAAANWQLERDVEFFKKFLVVSLGIYPLTAELMAQDFKAAMRPQKSNC